jgi:hypothetical protein
MNKEWTRHQCRKAALPNHRYIDWEYIVLLIKDAALRGEGFAQIPPDTLLTEEQEKALLELGFSVSDITAPSADPCKGDGIVGIRIYWIG